VTAPLPCGPAERAALQRERILRAARRCFAERGFHAASMADIAGAARISPGLIYRYFESKNALVRAIVDRHLEETHRILDQIGSSHDLVSAILAAFERWVAGGDAQMSAALALEMTALAARDPETLAAMQEADRSRRERLREALVRSGGAAWAGEATAPASGCATMLQCLIEGLLVRAVLQPGIDRSLLRAALEAALAPPAPPGGPPLRRRPG
jgi:AcrR family transcriptional regulator